MATENKSNSNKYKKRKSYLPHSKAVKKGAYPLRPGVEGFFITCDGGREHQASQEAIDVIDSFFEELLEGKESKFEQAELPKKPGNKIIRFEYSDSSSSEGDDDDDGTNGDGDAKDKNGTATGGDESLQKQAPPEELEKPVENQGKQEVENVEPDDGTNGDGDAKDKNGTATGGDESLQKQAPPEELEKPVENQGKQEVENVEPPVKKQCTETGAINLENVPKKVEEKKSVDKLIEAELAELGDKSKRRFTKLDTGCNGVVFVQMRKKEGDPSPKDIVQHMMTSLASTKKHVSRFLLRVLPVEVSCYTSEEEIQRAIKPLIEKHFPEENQVPRKFAVLYDARANTGVDRTKVINAVAKSVPSLHKVDLTNPDINIIVQIAKTVCLIGVVEKYKELAKYNLRQLTSSNK